MDTAETERGEGANMGQYATAKGNLHIRVYETWTAPWIELHLIMDPLDRANGIAVLEQSTAFSAFFALPKHSPG